MSRSPMSAPSTRCRFLFFFLSSSTTSLVTTALFILAASTHEVCGAGYYGKLIGKLSELHHGVSGEVYAVDGRTLYIKDFKYDGEGPTAYFYAGNSKNPNDNGFRVRDERGTFEVLRKYRKKDITLTLPEGKTLNNIKWFSVWCDEFAVNFGDVRIPRGFEYPRPQKLAGLSGVHGVSSEPVVVVDAQTLLIPGFSYDGEAPDAKFWVGSGPNPSPQGIRVPDENGKVQPLRRYNRKTIVLTLPGDLTVHQLGHFGVWCEAFTVDFGHVQIPSGLNVPPSLKMLGVSPQSKLNCEVLEDSLAFEVRWAVAGDSIVVQLVAKLDAGQYMSFGLSANPDRSVMVGGDVVVAWVDKQTLQGYAFDYFLDAKSQCSGRRGSCPDTRIQEKTNSVRLLNAAMVNGYSIVTYQRPLKASDELDREIRTNGSQAIIWAVGPLNERLEVSFHTHYLKTDSFIEFGRPPAWNCPMPEGDMHVDSVDKESKQDLVATTRRPHRPPPPSPATVAKKGAWVIPPIQCNEPDDNTFYAQMGPTGGQHGYPAITGHVGWGLAWYINGLLIPEMNVVRGKTYTFVVEAGEDAAIPARYHPFYITDDPIGGYHHKTPEEKAKVKIFAGVRRQRGNVIPTGYGRFCYWVHDQNQPDADEFASFGAYQRTLTLQCDHGEPGLVQWTPDANTPDTVYYQCFTHRYLGWKINVVDSCDEPEIQASETHEIYARPPEMEVEESDNKERAPSKVTPAPENHDHHRNVLSHHHSHHRNNNDNNNHHSSHQSHQIYNHHHHPHPNAPTTMEHGSRYNLHRHVNYPKYIIPISNDHQPMIMPGKLVSTIINANNSPKLTASRLNGPLSGKYEIKPHHHSSMKPFFHHPNPHYQQQSGGAHNNNNNNNNNHHHYHHHHENPRHTGEMRPTGLARPNDPTSAFYRQVMPERGPSVPSSIFGSSGNLTFGKTVSGEKQVDQEVRQSDPVGTAISPASSSNQASNLVTDQRAIMSYGQVKYAFSHPSGSQYLYSRPGASTSTSAHQISMNLSPKASQLMMIRRPIAHHLSSQRRPILGSMMMNPNQPEIPSVLRPIRIMERKKAIYHGPMSEMIHSTAKQNIPRVNSIQDDNNSRENDMNSVIHRIMYTFKSNNNERTAAPLLKTKVSSKQDPIERNSIIHSEMIKPAINTGFDPDSIIIESGFKPIITSLDAAAAAAAEKTKNFVNLPIETTEDYAMDEPGAEAESSVQDDANDEEKFEPMFVPSPLDRKKQKNKMKKRFQNRRKSRLDLDDMEMAADRLDSRYLPPTIVAPKKLDHRPSIGGSGGLLVTFDGKRIEDPSLARSIPRSDETKRSKSRLSSEILSETPQFGKFKGELPPLISAEITNSYNTRPENLGSPADLIAANSPITKLAPLNRHKRFSQRHEINVNYGSGNDSAHHHHHHQSDDKKTSTGEMLFANMQYVFLTVVLYYAI